MKCHTVSLSSIKASDKRIDPSFHLSEAQELMGDILQCPYKVGSIENNVEKVFLGNIFSRIFVKDSVHGIPYLAASDTVLSDIDTGRFLSKRQAHQLDYLKLHKDWIVITCSGTIGNVTYTNETFENHIATHDLIRIIPDQTKLLRGYLYSFLSSKYGHNQLTQSRFGGVVKHINAEHVNNILLPIFPIKKQQIIDKLIQESATLRANSKKLLDQSKKLLADFVGFAFKPTPRFIISSNSIKDISKSFRCRLNPSPYVNRSISFFNKLELPCKNLGDCNVKVWYPGMFKRAYVDNGLPYIQGSALFESNPFKCCDHLSKSKTPKLEDLWLYEDLILITCAGSCGQVKLITKEYQDKNAIGSPDIIRIKSNDSIFSTEYLFVYFQMPWAQDYMQSLKYGSVIERFDAQSVMTIPVVQPTLELNQQIKSMINEYKNCLYRAFCLEEQAIQLVEQEIESWGKKN